MGDWYAVWLHFTITVFSFDLQFRLCRLRHSFVLQLNQSSVYRQSPFALIQLTKLLLSCQTASIQTTYKNPFKINSKVSHCCNVIARTMQVQLVCVVSECAVPVVFDSHFSPLISHNAAFDSPATELRSQYAPDEPISSLLLSAPV